MTRSYARAAGWVVGPVLVLHQERKRHGAVYTCAPSATKMKQRRSDLG
jgi:hypothetical protein